MEDLNLFGKGTQVYQNKSLKDTCTSYGVHDSLRYGLRNITQELVSTHPLQSHLAQYEENQLDWKLTMNRQISGLHSPLRTLMELDILSQCQRHPMFKSSNLGYDILMGKDETLDVEDFLNDPEYSHEMVDPHASMEKLLGITL